MACYSLHLFTIVIILYNNVSYNPCLCCPLEQKQALIQFKNSLLKELMLSPPPGASLSGLETWNSSSNCCRWERVDCHPTTKQVTYLSLYNLIPSLVDVTTMGVVSSDHVLTPLFSISSLMGVDMSKNLILGGEIPILGFQNFTKLTHLYMSHNKLSGSISSAIGSLKNLQSLYLDHNFLHGKLPDEIGNLTDLHTLSLRQNQLSGQIPLSLSNQTRLQRLDLSENDLEGEFPLWLAEMEIRGIVLSDNKLSGSLPPRLFQSKSLSFLDLSRNNFSGELPENIKESNIMVLLLSENNFSGSIPESLSNFPYLGLLDLSRNSFSGNKFPTFNNKSSLTFINLSSNRLSGEIPTGFGPQTIMLSLGENQFFGSLPENLTKYTNLIYLDLQGNNISGKIPSFLSHLSSLQVLSLRNNSLTGSLPSNLSNLTHLHILDLSENKIVGNIPSSLGKLSGMINSLNTSSFSSMLILFTDQVTRELVPFGSISLPNMFTDLIVDWKSSKQGLSRHDLDLYSLLNLSKNQFSGQIPSSLGELKSLKLLNLSHNELNGSIPMSFGDLQSVEILDLSHNSLSGGIPTTFSMLLEVTNLDLSNNKLVGRIPSSPQLDRLNNPDFYANNSGLCGMQIQVTCPRELARGDEREETERSEELFSWEACLFGFPVGFVVSVVMLYCSGFFTSLRTNRSGVKKSKNRTREVARTKG